MSFKNWSYDADHDRYVGSHTTVDKLKSGLYVVYVDDYGKPVATLKQRKDDRIVRFKYGPLPHVLTEIGRFWEMGNRYKELGVTHKRGLLLHGPHGCGKTAIVASAIDDVLEKGGVAIELSHPGALTAFLPLCRKIDGERPTLILMEDLDHLANEWEEDLLEMMDGASSLGHNILFLATTNNLESIPTRIRCRPSRIDTLIEVPKPNEKQRLEYLRFLCAGKFAQHEDVLQTWADKSQDFSLAALKELVISVIVFEHSVDEAVAKLKQMTDDE
jgi:chromosomal replication initiation ATPase DnaA